MSDETTIQQPEPEVQKPTASEPRKFQSLKTTLKKEPFAVTQELWETGNVLNKNVRHGVENVGIIPLHARAIMANFFERGQVKPVVVLKNANFHDGNAVIIGGHHTLWAFNTLFTASDEELKELNAVRPNASEKLSVLYVDEPSMTWDEAVQYATIDNAGRSSGPMDIALRINEMLRQSPEDPENPGEWKKAEMRVRDAIRSLAGPAYRDFRLSQLRYYQMFPQYVPADVQAALQDPSNNRITPSTVSNYMQLIKYGIRTPEEVAEMLSDLAKLDVRPKGLIAHVKKLIREHETATSGRKHSRGAGQIVKAAKMACDYYGEKSGSWIQKFLAGDPNFTLENCAAHIAWTGNLLAAVETAEELNPDNATCMDWLMLLLAGDGFPGEFGALLSDLSDYAIEWRAERAAHYQQMEEAAELLTDEEEEEEGEGDNATPDYDDDDDDNDSETDD